MPEFLWSVPASVIRFAESVTEELAKDLSRFSDTQPVELVDAIERGLFEMRKRQLFNMLMRIRNGSPGAVRVCELFDRGEIDGERMLELLGQTNRVFT